MLRQVFSNIHKSKKNLYISIVRSNLLYCSPLWRPYQIKDILNLERIQCRASKYILGDYTSDYKTRLRLIKLNLQPLMYIYELLDILFFIKSYNSPINSFNIFQYVTFNNSFTRSRDKKLIHIASKNLNLIHIFVEFLYIDFGMLCPLLILLLHLLQSRANYLEIFFIEFFFK